ncbi:hypothetical protein [Streptomyces europaeiscabiei]|uniref:hypothetical protein n=1 Tax=Streptomyces europaeiscabiei TaxID=146819 RepID=UPI0029BBCC2C|nr:hypothetical protein [Streptomyces europaeiscabiei]MDX2766997.1 hypothetical protein [Streptomyces europaeiscabiei]
MNSVFGNLGIVGLAVVLTVLLLVGVKGGGKMKPLGWWPCLVLGMLAGSSYYAAGGIFKIVPDLVAGGLAAVQGLVPGLTMAAIVLTLAIVAGFVKLSTKQVAILGVVFWYAASAAGGVWGQVATAIANLGTQVS